MTPDQNNYRKAKPDEISCMDCKRIVRPKFRGARHRCKPYRSAWHSYVVGKHHTCDKAERPEGGVNDEHARSFCNRTQ